MDFSLPRHLRLCGDCGAASAAMDEQPLATCLRCKSAEQWRGPSGYCQYCDEAMRQAIEQDAPIVEHLRAILRNFVQKDFSGRPWSGMEFAKGHFGNMVLGALGDLGCDRGRELRSAMGLS